MRKQNINNYYTDEDLINFEKLKNFNGSKVNKLNNNQNKSHPVRYAISDSKHFDRIMNINNDRNSLSKNTKKTKNNNYYSSLDLKNFNKLKQLAIFNNSETINKKTGVVKNKTNYTANDVNAFDQIIKFEGYIKNVNKEKINSKVDTKKPSSNKIISRVDNRKIKIIDFNKLKEKEKILKNKVGIEKIKIVYFD